jgi:hypothetical protein
MLVFTYGQDTLLCFGLQSEVIEMRKKLDLMLEFEKR